MTDFRILIVDDEPSIRRILKDRLEKDGYQVFEAEDGKSALEEISKRDPHLVLLDFRLPLLDGMEVLKTARENDPERLVVMITAYGSIDVAVNAMKLGASDFITKPLNPDHVTMVVARTLERKVLMNHVRYLGEESEKSVYEMKKEHGIEEIIGESPQIREVIETVLKVAPTDAAVLIQGGTGTGKELFAKVIHNLSPRKDWPMVPINCAAIPDTLLESELFGHEKGSFTGACRLQKGRFELANRGTILLDEIGELPLGLQAKMLRAVESGAIERIGSSRPIEADVRIIAATTRNLEQEARVGKFREELYYRLNVVNLTLPALRERGHDILLLAERFLNRYARKYRKNIKGFDSEARRAMNRYDWPGNVRELEHKVERAVIMTAGEDVSAKDLELDILTQGTQLLKEKEECLKVELITDALSRNLGNVSRSAKDLGIGRRTLQGYMKKYKIDRDHFRGTQK